MKIVYITQHFPPEIGAAQGRAYDMSKNLQSLGHEMFVLTTFPNNEKSFRLYQKENMNDMKVYRSFRVKDTKASVFQRLANYFSFAFSSSLAGMFIRKPDIIFATSPQLFQGITGYFLSRFHRAKFVFEVRDLWVDFAELLSQITNKRMLKLARKLEIFLYKKADLIVTVTEGYKQKLIHLGIPEQKIVVVTNGVNPTDIINDQPRQDIKKIYQIEDKFLILYAGNIGAAQGLDVMIDAAQILHNKKDIVFMLIGEGVEKERLKQKTKNLGLTNVIFVDSKKKSQLTDYFQAADLGLVTLKKHPLFDITIPSKVFDYMAMSTPILIGVGGEAKEIVEKHQTGYAFDPENTEDLVRVLTTIVEHPEKLEELKGNLVPTILKFYNREILAKNMSNAMLKIVDNDGGMLDTNEVQKTSQ